MSKIGIFGGTFNPIHNGHVLLAKYCKEELDLDKVLLIPTYSPPHKVSADLANETDRLNMCRIVCKNLEGFEVLDIEIRRKGKSYSYQTLTSLKEIYHNDDLYFMMGADMFLSLDKWKNPEIIFQKASIIAVPRDISSVNELEYYYKNVIAPMGATAHILQNSVMQVSSTYVRENIENYNIVKDLIDSRVYDYITANNLYRM
ncbi:MAG: nicotinate-nucleotide adenylyltransferase [Ruminococcus sp.]|nr:nicotinate-nucleotide adenylyltransferase [Ruminococcus sp.]